ncbi:MAG: hypothetical protein Q8L48_07960 [Archangium sp.]|nr:hypothetical protein [Archangium sp.]
MPRPHLPAGLAGLLGVLLNVVAVGALQVVPHTYRPGDVPAWLAETVAHPGATTVSAWAFTVGLVALAAFCAGLAFAVRSPWVVVGACLFGFGALLDAAGTMGPLAALHVDQNTGIGLLWMSLLLDSAFNGLLGLGLICFAIGLPAEWPKGLRVLALVAGVVSLPVALQFHADDFARLLAVAGPLWLVWVTGASVVLMRRDRG